MLMYLCDLFLIAAPPISITVNETCSNDFTVSWTTTSDGIGSSYNVTLSPPSSILTTMDNSYNFTGLIPNTDYNVTIRAIQCLGAPTTMMITTSTRKAAVPSSELMLLYTDMYAYVHMYVYGLQFCITRYGLITKVDVNKQSLYRAMQSYVHSCIHTYVHCRHVCYMTMTHSIIILIICHL